MKLKQKAFVDSDVVISSLISDEGAARMLMEQDWPELYLSNYSETELKRVVERLGLKEEKLVRLTKKRMKRVELKGDKSKLKAEYGDWVLDANDAHVVAGAVKAGARFLVTYNRRHYRVEKIRRDWGIKVVTPGRYLQYLRSLS